MPVQTSSMNSPIIELQADDLKPYVVKFTVAYVISCVVVGLASWFLQSTFNIDVPSTGVSIATMLGGILYACDAFVKTNGRLFSQRERKYITWASFIMSWLVSLLMGLLLLLGFSVVYGDELFDELSAMLSPLMTGPYLMMFVLLMAFVMCIDWFIIYWMYGSFAKSQLKAFEKSKSKV